MSLWVLLLIRYSTFTLLSDVRHITHTCTQQHSPSSVIPSLYRAPPRAEAFYLLVLPLLHKEPLAACTVVVASCAADRRPRSHPSSNRGSDTTVGSLGELEGPSTSRLEQPHKQERHHTLTQNLKTMSL